MITDVNKKYKVLIPTAGVGSRLGNYCDHVNKTLIPVAGRPIISFIIEKFSPDIELIIDLGHKGELVQEFLTLAYPDRSFTFVWAKRNGLTADLCDYKNILQCPFIFFTNDAIVAENIPAPDYDWIGCSNIKAGNDYRSIVIDSWDSAIAKDLGEKGVHTEAKAYIGICGIHNYQKFWEFMDKAIINGTKNQGESFALAKMVKSQQVKCAKFTWYDTGTTEGLIHANNTLSKGDSPNLLPKTEEHIWFCNDRVIKFSTDKHFVSQRVDRAKILAGYVPQIEGSTTNMYCYRMINGDVLSNTITVPRFKEFISWSKKLWSDRKLLTIGDKEIYKLFYRNKTFNRVQSYFDRFNYVDSEQHINGVKTPTVNAMLNLIDWDWISNGVPVRFHGDFHFENIIDSMDNFSSIDWRENFGGLIDYGDIYYDLAKLLHGLIVSHGIIYKGLYKIDIDKTIVNFDLLRRQTLIDCATWFKQYLIQHNYDFYKVEILTALIYLNIATLHHQPYAEMLFHLGKLMLWNLLKKESNI